MNCNGKLEWKQLTRPRRARFAIFRHVLGHITNTRAAKSKDHYNMLIEWNIEPPIAMNRWELIEIDIIYESLILAKKSTKYKNPVKPF